MATLRELRKQAKDLGITYEKTTNAEALQEMIAETLCEKETPTESVTREPVKESPAPAPAPAPESNDSPAERENAFSTEVAINEGDLNTEFKEQASKYAGFATAEANAKARVLTAKLRLEVVDSQMTKQIRERLVKEGVKATEKMISSEVITTKEYQVAQNNLIEAQRAADIARGVKEAFQQRKDMLIQLGSSKRQEIDQIGMNLKEKALATMKKAS